MSMQPGEIGPIPEETVRVARASFPKGCLALWLRDELGAVYQDRDFGALFAVRGQPAEAPWRLAVVTVLQFAEGLTDRQAADAVRGRIDWKYSLGLALTDAGFDFSLLSEFRDRLVAKHQEGQLLDRLLRRCQERGWVKAGGRQRTDSSHVLAAIRRLNRLQVVGETLRHALGQVATAAPDWLREQITPEWTTRYGRRFEEGRLPKHAAEQTRLAEQIGADGAALLTAVDQPTAPAALAALAAVRTVRRVWWQQYYAPDAAGRRRWRTAQDLPPAAQAIHSPYDVEARYSTKRTTTWVGYKDHFTETCDPGQPHLVTEVTTTPGTTADSEITAQVQANLATKGLLPAEHLVDEGYTDAALLVSSRTAYDIDLVGPVHRDSSRQARAGQGFDLSHFRVDWAARTATCPNGRTSRTWSPTTNDYGDPVIKVAFAREACAGCPVRARCTAAAADPRTLTLRPQAEHQALAAARARQDTPGFRAAYATRAGVEGTIAQATGAFGARRTRYRGLAKTHLQAVATAAAINLHRLWDWSHHPLAYTPRLSPFATLFAT